MYAAHISVKQIRWSFSFYVLQSSSLDHNLKMSVCCKVGCSYRKNNRRKQVKIIRHAYEKRPLTGCMLHGSLCYCSWISDDKVLKIRKRYSIKILKNYQESQESQGRGEICK